MRIFLLLFVCLFVCGGWKGWFVFSVNSVVIFVCFSGEGSEREGLICIFCSPSGHFCLLCVCVCVCWGGGGGGIRILHLHWSVGFFFSLGGEGGHSAGWLVCFGGGGVGGGWFVYSVPTGLFVCCFFFSWGVGGGEDWFVHWSSSWSFCWFIYWLWWGWGWGGGGFVYTVLTGWFVCFILILILLGGGGRNSFAYSVLRVIILLVCLFALVEGCILRPNWLVYLLSGEWGERFIRILCPPRGHSLVDVFAFVDFSGGGGMRGRVVDLYTLFLFVVIPLVCLFLCICCVCLFTLMRVGWGVWGLYAGLFIYFGGGGGGEEEGLTCTLCPLHGHPAGLFVYFGEGGMRSMRGRGVDLYTLSPVWSLCWSVCLLWWWWGWGGEDEGWGVDLYTLSPVWSLCWSVPSSAGWLMDVLCPSLRHPAIQGHVQG